MRVVPSWRRYFASDDDVVSMLTIPIVPNLVYAALLASVGIALHRRMRSAWWILLIWWVVLPQLDRIARLLDGGSPVNAVGFVLISVVLVVLLRSRRQFPAKAVRGSFLRAAALFLVGGVVVLVVGSWLVTRFGEAPGTASAAQLVWDGMLGDVGEVDTARRPQPPPRCGCTR